MTSLSLKIVPLPGGQATSSNGFIHGHPGLSHKPITVTGNIQIHYPHNRNPKIESLIIYLEGKVSFPDAKQKPTEKTDAKQHFQSNTDSYELITLKKHLIDLRIPMKLSEMWMDNAQPNHLKHHRSTSSVGVDRTPADQPKPSSQSVSSSSSSISSAASSTSPQTTPTKTHGTVEVKFTFPMSAQEAADLPPSADMELPENITPHKDDESVGIKYQLRAVARFVGTFEDTELVETVELIWPKFHPDAVARVVGLGERKVKRFGPGWRWEILSGVAGLGDMRPVTLFLEPQVGEIKRDVANVKLTLTETKEWSHLKGAPKKERVMEVGSYSENFPGEFMDKTFTFALPLSLNLQPTLDYDPVKITHKLTVTIDAPSLPSSEEEEYETPRTPTTTKPALQVKSEIPYAMAGFTRDDCDELVSCASNLPESVLSQIPPHLIGKRLKDMEFIKFSAETLNRIVKDRPMAASPPRSASSGAGGLVRSPWTSFQNLMTAVKRGRKTE
ncbi:hypothetical protein HDU97_006850 [Phlyctochytrium planicorne]|nr:hypothetical protein HDU97_006850 [Phlyctochytrium planicorne]